MCGNNCCRCLCPCKIQKPYMPIYPYVPDYPSTWGYPVVPTTTTVDNTGCNIPPNWKVISG